MSMKLVAGVTSLVAVALAQSAAAQDRQPYTTWSDFGGSADAMQYSALAQINRTNVGQLEPVWFHAVAGPAVQLMFNPLIVDGVMYVLGEESTIVALDAATGEQLWSSAASRGTSTDRGISYWESKDRSDRRLIYAGGGGIRQIDARTGAAITTFGDNGRVDMRTPSPGNPRPLGGPPRTPPRVFENLIIVGSNTGEGYGSPPGDVRAYDVVTGELVWTFRTVPIPGDHGYESYANPDAWRFVGGNNVWGEISVDEARGIAYLPTGSPTHDIYGADRVGENLFGNSVIALNARTGQRLWHFQTIHHDLWDYDLVAAPKLLTVRHNGELVDIVAQPGKTGFLYVFNRVTGEPLWPIEERPVPRSEVPGEIASSTQPFPTKPPPFARQHFTVDDVNPYVPAEERERLRQMVANAANEGLFTPSSHLRYHIQNPGAWGGANWGSTAGDPETGMLYVRTFEIPAYRIMAPRVRASPAAAVAPEGSIERQGQQAYAQTCAVCHGPGQIPLPAVEQLGAENFRNIVRAGREQMPAFNEEVLPPEELEAIRIYLLHLQAAEPASPGSESANEDGDHLAPSLDAEGRYRGPRVEYSGSFSAAMLAENGLPAIGPPWSELVAYDLNEGTIRWRVPNGTAPGLVALGITDTGAFRTRASPVVTAGGLIFLASRPDQILRAFDKDTGEVLWEHELDVYPQGIPSVYEVNGRQYVVFAAGAGDVPGPLGLGRKPAVTEAQGYYVFALPEAGR